MRAKLKKFGGQCYRGHAMRFTGRRLVCDSCQRARAVTSETREQAAILCSMRATDEANQTHGVVPVMALFGRKAMRVHWAAYCRAIPPEGIPAYLAWAEAEAMLREGWAP